MTKPFVALLAALLSATAAAERFSFVALGDTAYNGERDYPVYRRLIGAINEARPAFSVHVGDIWGVGNCHDPHIERIGEFFDLYDHPLVYTPGDNEWVDCGHRAMGGYDPIERLSRLRKSYFAEPMSLGRKPMTLVRQSDVSPFEEFAENSRWEKDGVLFVTLNVSGSRNNFDVGNLDALKEAYRRNQANVAWLRDGFRLAREGDYAALVVALHAEMFWNESVAPEFADVVQELRLGSERFARPVLLIHGDSHQFTVDRPLMESRGEAEMPLYRNVVRLEVFGAPEIGAVRVDVDTDTPWVFGYSPLYVD